jgi:sulfate transport system permease protein
MTASASTIPGSDRRTPARPERFGWGRLAARGTALTYLLILLIIPLGVILQDGLQGGLGGLWHAVSGKIPLSALWLTLWTAAIMALINAVMGTLTAYVLVRYNFTGKAILNGVIDLPLSIPTLVTGVMLVVLYGPQTALGSWLQNNLGWRIIFAPPGIILALLFVTYPFVVRAVQPVLEGLDHEPEEASATLGASAWTTFRRVTLPALLLPVSSGTLLSFARAIGEFGAIVIVAGNIPFRSQTAAVYVLSQVESENRQGASAMSVVMLAISLSLVLLVDWLRARSQKGMVAE